MIRATSEDKELIIGILTRSFDENGSINYVVRQGKNRKKRIRALIEYSFNLCYHFGEVWLTDDHTGCCLTLYPEIQKTTFKTIMWDLRLALYALGIRKVMQSLKRKAILEKFYPKGEKYCYLWYIGVDPEKPQKSSGRRLLSELIKKYEEENRAIYGETSVDRNVPMYERYGFKTFHTLQFDRPLYLMRRLI